MSADLARAAGPVGAAGLVVLMLAPARYQRLGGLAAWAIGAAVLAAYLAQAGTLLFSEPRLSQASSSPRPARTCCAAGRGCWHSRRSPAYRRGSR